MRHILVIYVLILLSLSQAEKRVKVQKPEITKLEVVNLGEAEIEPDPEQSDVQRKRDSEYSYSRPNRVSSSSRFRFQVHQSKGQIASKVPSLLIRPFTKYGPPNHSTSDPIAHGYAEQQRNKLQHQVNQQQPVRFGDGLVDQEVPSPIRNVDFAEVNPIASQNNEPFGMHTANYLPPQNQKLPAYASTNNFTPQSHSPNSLATQVQSSQSENFIPQSQNHQISDAALFLSENSQAIQQLYGAPASNQDFAPGNEQFHDTGNQIQRPNDHFRDFESISQSPQEFHSTLPSYASGTLNPRETLEQIQSLEKDRLIVQLRQALALAAQTTPSAEAAARYAQNQASFIQNQELLASISQQMKRISATPQTAIFASGNAAFSQSPFLPGTTINPLELPLNYGVPTTVQTPTTTTIATGAPVAQPPSKGDGTAQVASPQSPPNPESPAINSAVEIPIYGGFVPTLITGSNLVPSYATSILASGPVRPIQSTGVSPTHFGIPIPTEPPAKPRPTIPATTTPSTGLFKPDQAGVAWTPALTPVALPVQPMRPVSASLHPLATPVHPVLPVANPVQAHPVSVQHTYDVQTALINPGVLYKPIKTVYPNVFYYPNVAYQKPAVTGWPSYPWSYAPSYAQTKPVQLWK